MLKLSVTVITKNEADKIRACLESVRFADEIVVVDSGSTDATPEICREYTDKFYQRGWTGFPDQRQYACSIAKGPWILILDADERVSETLRQELQAVLAKDDQPLAYYEIRRREHLLGAWVEGGDWNRDHLRLFRKDVCGCEFTRDVHERIKTTGTGGKLNGPIFHLSHASSGAFLERISTYTALEAALANRQGRRFSWMRALFAPLAVFTYRFIWHGGYRDGVRGLALAGLQSFYRFLQEIKLWELTRQEAGKDE